MRRCFLDRDIRGREIEDCERTFMGRFGRSNLRESKVLRRFFSTVGTKERERMYGIREGGIHWILVRRGMDGIGMDGGKEGRKVCFDIHTAH